MNAGKRVFITGGASGLGRALAHRYAKAGWRVLVSDVQAVRAEETLALLRSTGAEAAFLPCDVTSEEALKNAAAWLDEHWGGVDLVFNNAGVAVSGRIEDVPLSDWQWILDVNLLGVVRGCKIFTDIFKRQGHGHLVNVASLAGLVHMPLMAPYNATKAAVVALSETLHAELADCGVKVSVVCPYFFRTNLIDGARCSDPALGRTARRLVNEARRGPDEIAALIYQGVARGKAHILTDAVGRGSWRLKRWLPFSLFAKCIAQVARQA